MAVSLYDISFKETFDQKVLCKLILSSEDISALQDAIEDLYYFEFVYGKMYIVCLLGSLFSCSTVIYKNTFILDDLPIRGFLGHLEEGPVLPHNHKTYLWTHLHFTFEYNGQQVLPTVLADYVTLLVTKVISANVSTNGVVPVNLNDITAPLEVTHTYSARWFSTK